jgi:fido (protein-threonine AMPylation protein)
MSGAKGRVVWRWEERDFGFRFRAGKGKRSEEYYQAARAGEFYIVPKSKRKLSKERADELAGATESLTSPRVVKLPWQNYDQDWDWIATAEGILLNYAGCLDKEQINRREDEGVQRAMEHVALLIERSEPVPLTVSLIQRLHEELMGAIYPFAGKWRTVGLHKGDGPIKWPLPPCGIEPLVDLFERDVLSRSPLIEKDDSAIFTYASEVMNEFLALHRRGDEKRYFAACETGRVNKDYEPLQALITEWADRAHENWEADHEA